MTAPTTLHGSRGMYRRGCRCVPCTGRQRAYERMYRQEHPERRVSVAAARRAQAEREAEEERAWLALKVEVEPLQLFLQRKVMALGISNVAAACGVSARRIATVIQGSYTKDGKRYRIAQVRVATADAWCVALGEPLRCVYPHHGE